MYVKLWRLQWAGHVVRMDDKRTPERVLIWSMDDKRLKGRPRKIWEDAVAVDAREMLGAVSYTHLDVYKRQAPKNPPI